MQYMKFLLKNITSFRTSIFFIKLSPPTFAQRLVSTLSLRIGPGKNLPHNIELFSEAEWMIAMAWRLDDQKIRIVR